MTIIFEWFLWSFPLRTPQPFHGKRGKPKYYADWKADWMSGHWQLKTQSIITPFPRVWAYGLQIINGVLLRPSLQWVNGSIQRSFLMEDFNTGQLEQPHVGSLVSEVNRRSQLSINCTFKNNVGAVTCLTDLPFLSPLRRETHQNAAAPGAAAWTYMEK